MFEKKICAFVDVLGFKEAVLNADADPEFASKLKSILDVMSSCSNSLNSDNLWEVVAPALKQNTTEKVDVQVPLKSSEHIKSTAFSDSLVISSESDYRGATNLILALNLMIHDLLSVGIMARGAISVGNLFHKGNTVFGKALVDAYEMESAISIFPRICASDELLQLLKSVELAKGALSNFFVQDFDGIFMLDYFGAPCLKIASLNDEEQDWEIKQHLSKLGTRIDKTGENVRRIAQDGSPNSYRVLAKLRWLVQYYKKSMEMQEFFLPLEIELPSIT